MIKVFSFYCALLYRARLCHSKSSICLFACPSVTFRYADHTSWIISKIIPRLISLRFVLGLTPNRTETPRIWVEWEWGYASQPLAQFQRVFRIVADIYSADKVSQMVNK